MKIYELKTNEGFKPQLNINTELFLLFFQIPQQISSKIYTRI